MSVWLLLLLIGVALIVYVFAVELVIYLLVQRFRRVMRRARL